MKDPRFNQVVATLNNIAVKGEEDCKRLLACIQVLREMEAAYAAEKQPE